MDRDKVRGMFLGVAIGDALGMPIETMPPEMIRERFGRITTYLRPDGHKWFNGREAGTWTDDTQLTLVVAESLIEHRGINIDDLAQRHIAAMRKVDLGWGQTTRDAITRLEEGIHWSESGKTADPRRGRGNGTIMKLGPLGAYLTCCIKTATPQTDIGAILKNIVDVALMTHHNGLSEAAVLAHLRGLFQCFMRSPKAPFPSRFIAIDIGLHAAQAYLPDDEVLRPDGLIERLRSLSGIAAHPWTDQEIARRFDGGTCYVLNSLPFSYAFFLRNPHSVEALYGAVNAGGDTDSNGSIVGALLGALNGTAVFPQHLVDGLWQRERILDTADRFADIFATP